MKDDDLIFTPHVILPAQSIFFRAGKTLLTGER
jgi:hypothetical protein